MRNELKIEKQFEIHKYIDKAKKQYSIQEIVNIPFFYINCNSFRDLLHLDPSHDSDFIYITLIDEDILCQFVDQTIRNRRCTNA